MARDILCIGSVLWDIIGWAAGRVAPGGDVPGRIRRQPGGVALNIATALAARGLRPVLLGAVGQDAEGRDLVAALDRLGLVTTHLCRTDTPTDRYLAIEDSRGLVGAVADVGTLEAAGDVILAPLCDGRLAAPWTGPVAIDGNLTADLLAEIATSPLFAQADLRVVPASPAKARRLRPLLGHPGVTLYLNLAEACALLAAPAADPATAAAALVAAGVRRAVVTDGAGPVADAMAGAPLLSATPPAVTVARVTGAGDAFMAAHLDAEQAGHGRASALQAALEAAARHVSAPPERTPHDPAPDPHARSRRRAGRRPPRRGA